MSQRAQLSIARNIKLRIRCGAVVVVGLAAFSIIFSPVVIRLMNAKKKISNTTTSLLFVILITNFITDQMLIGVAKNRPNKVQELRSRYLLQYYTQERSRPHGAIFQCGISEHRTFYLLYAKENITYINEQTWLEMESNFESWSKEVMRKFGIYI